MPEQRAATLPPADVARTRTESPAVPGASTETGNPGAQTGNGEAQDVTRVHWIKRLGRGLRRQGRAEQTLRNFAESPRQGAAGGPPDAAETTNLRAVTGESPDAAETANLRAVTGEPPDAAETANLRAITGEPATGETTNPKPEAKKRSRLKESKFYEKIKSRWERKRTERFPAVRRAETPPPSNETPTEKNARFLNEARNKSSRQRYKDIRGSREGASAAVQATWETQKAKVDQLVIDKKITATEARQLKGTMDSITNQVREGKMKYKDFKSEVAGATIQVDRMTDNGPSAGVQAQTERANAAQREMITDPRYQEIVTNLIGNRDRSTLKAREAAKIRGAATRQYHAELRALDQDLNSAIRGSETYTTRYDALIGSGDITPQEADAQAFAEARSVEEPKYRAGVDAAVAYKKAEEDTATPEVATPQATADAESTIVEYASIDQSDRDRIEHAEDFVNNFLPRELQNVPVGEMGAATQRAVEKYYASEQAQKKRNRDRAESSFEYRKVCAEMVSKEGAPPADDEAAQAAFKERALEETARRLTQQENEAAAAAEARRTAAERNTDVDDDAGADRSRRRREPAYDQYGYDAPWGSSYDRYDPYDSYDTPPWARPRYDRYSSPWGRPRGADDTPYDYGYGRAESRGRPRQEQAGRAPTPIDLMADLGVDLKGLDANDPDVRALREEAAREGGRNWGEFSRNLRNLSETVQRTTGMDPREATQLALSIIKGKDDRDGGAEGNGKYGNLLLALLKALAVAGVSVVSLTLQGAEALQRTG